MAETGKAISGTARPSPGRVGASPARTAAKKAQNKMSLSAALKKVTEPLVFGLDIGTRSIVGTVGYRTGTNRFVVVAQVSAEHTTRAMLDGQIHDIQAVAQTVTKVKQQLEKMLDRRLTDVCIAAAGRVLKTVVATARVDFNYETVVTDEHIYSLDMLGVEHAYDNLRQEQCSDDIRFYCVGYSVIRYYQNDYPITNLEGHKANSIQTELIATFLPNEVVDGLYAAVEKAGLFVASLTLEPIAAINVAIPEQFRLLNIALVDVGAGTSDISITDDGGIIAYGMIPAAGDEITECIARKYLLDFREAERLKCECSGKKQVVFYDIMGLSHKMQASEVIDAVEPTVREITKRISDRIRELNGGKSVSAVFVVGGGGKIGGFVESLAEYLEIPKERVALRGPEVMGNIDFWQKEIKVDSLLVTPVGICLNYYEQKNSFIFVTLNGDRVKLYDNSKLTIMDAAIQVGYPNEDLFPKRGKTLDYMVNGEKRMCRGKAGDSAIVRLNGRESALSDKLSQNDKIEIIPSTRGEDASLSVSDLPEYQRSIRFTFNKKQICCPRFVRVNGELVSGFYGIREDDSIEIVEYYTLEQVLEFMDIVYRGKVYVNNALAGMETKVYDNFSVACEIKKEEPNYQELMREYGDGQIPEAVLNGEAREAEELAVSDFGAQKAEEQGTGDPGERPAVGTSRIRGAGKPPAGEMHAQGPMDGASPQGSERSDGIAVGEERADSGKGYENRRETEDDSRPGSWEETEDDGGSDSWEEMEDDGWDGMEDDGEYDSWEETKDDDEGDGAEEEISGTAQAGEEKAGTEEEIVDLPILVNGEDVILKRKKKYILVDVLDFYPFDLSVAKGDRLETLVNGTPCEFTEPLKAGDRVEIFWV